VQVIVERLLSIGTEIQVGESYGRRKTENEYAWEHIVNSPMLGVGLGGEYKPPSAQSIAWPGETRYIHNTYVNVATKMGVPALLALVALVTTMLVRGWTTIRIASSADRPIAVASFWTIMAAAVVTSLTQPNLISPGGAVSLAVAVFLTECVRARVQTKTKSSRVDIGSEVGE
jgi:O-antigen ligase